MLYKKTKGRTARRGAIFAAAVALSALGGSALAQTTITIESWRTDDSDIWNNQIIPAFEKANPDVDVVYNPTSPPEYNAALNSRLEGGAAGDIITCRPFDASLDLFNKGYLTPLNDLPGMDGFSDVAKAAWTTDDGKTTFCVPMASVIHGFFYNKKIFEELGLTPPKTVDEFYAVLDKIKENGQYVPLVLGTADQWEAATMGFQNIGPTYWKGEEGRKALIAGTAKLTDPPYVETFTQLAKWAPYLGDGYQAQKYSDSQNLFTLGQAAIYAAGSWDISLEKQADFEFGAFPPPVTKAGDTCYISDHTDIGIGLNAKSANLDAAKKFLAWVASPEFASIYANALPGFYPLSDTPVTIENKVAQEMVGWRQTCEETIRNSYQILSRGTPNLENELWNVSVGVLNGTMTPEDAAKKVQEGLDAWYKPSKG
jgi:raffinose/stachyose/melibiose transport system substrate-binding protein